MGFEFKPFTRELPPHAQLQEWADYHHIKLRWKDERTQTNGLTEWTSYPISMWNVCDWYTSWLILCSTYLSVQGIPYSDFVGDGPEKGHARRIAAAHIIACSNTL